MVEEPGGSLVRSVIRNLLPDDVPSATELSIAANWNQTPEDWHRIMQLSVDGCRCIEEGGKIVATLTLLPYAASLAWIGMVLTRAEYRRQGLARQLMEDVIAIAQRRGVRTLKLDATDEGRPLYESLGFIVEKPVERWARDREIAPSIAMPDAHNMADANRFDATHLCDNLFARDAIAFGAVRKDLLTMLLQSGRCTATPEAYVLSRPGTTARYLGPCIAGSEVEAAALIDAHLANDSYPDQDTVSKRTTWYWDLLPDNLPAVDCARRLGFTRRRRLWRMRRGDSIENNDAMVYAIAGFELG
jgi:GNAT superfamily N-acetyltransferase